jgi:hypothetical protein
MESSEKVGGSIKERERDRKWMKRRRRKPNKQRTQGKAKVIRRVPE